MAIRTRGAFQIRRLRARYRLVADRATYTIPYVGPYDQLQASQPGIDSAVTGFPSDFKVAEVTIDEGRSVEGKMTVTIEKLLSGATGSSSATQVGETIYELDWAEERRPIEEHKKMPSLKSDRKFYEFPDHATDSTTNPGWTGAAPSGTTGRQRTWEDWAVLDSDDVSGGTWSLTQYKSLKEKGYDDYPVAYPVARTTIYARFRIASPGGVWTISTPPGSCGAPSGWTYVKTASRNQKQGRQYTLVEEWRGYNRADSLFFL